MDTRAFINIPDWLKFKAATRELKLIKQLPKGELVFMRTTPTCIYDPPDLIPHAWPNIFWLIDTITPVSSPLLTTNNSNLKPTIIITELTPRAAIEAANKHLLATTALVIMNPY